MKQYTATYRANNH